MLVVVPLLHVKRFFYSFLYDGNRINDEDTPASLDMENDDTIDVMVEREFPASVFELATKIPYHEQRLVGRYELRGHAIMAYTRFLGHNLVVAIAGDPLSKLYIGGGAQPSPVVLLGSFFRISHPAVLHLLNHIN